MEERRSCMAVLEVVKWDGAPNVFAYRYPNCELTTKSQVVVYESQEAVFVKGGNIYGPLGPGRHVLDTQNDPAITWLMRHFVTNGQSPFVAEIWFVNKAIPLDIKWGTATPIQIEDPKYHIMMPIMATGQYGLQIENSQQFLAELVGRVPVFTAKTLSEYFRGIISTQIKDCIATYFVESSVSILHISSHLSEISKSLQDNLEKVISEYGVRLVAFTVNSISTDEKDPAVAKLKMALAKKAEMDIVGYTYQQEKSFDVMSKAAANQGGGAGAAVMQTGMGLGIGMGIGAPMGAAVGKMAGNFQFGFVVCPGCGAEMPVNVNFCPNCGAKKTDGVLPLHNSKPCPKCGEAMPHRARFCPNCGYSVVVKCVSCGSEMPLSSKFCPNCGKGI